MTNNESVFAVISPQSVIVSRHETKRGAMSAARRLAETLNLRHGPRDRHMPTAPETGYVSVYRFDGLNAERAAVGRRATMTGIRLADLWADGMEDSDSSWKRFAPRVTEAEAETARKPSLSATRREFRLYFRDLRASMREDGGTVDRATEWRTFLEAMESAETIDSATVAAWREAGSKVSGTVAAAETARKAASAAEYEHDMADMPPQSDPRWTDTTDPETVARREAAGSVPAETVAVVTAEGSFQVGMRGGAAETVTRVYQTGAGAPYPVRHCDPFGPYTAAARQAEAEVADRVARREAAEAKAGTAGEAETMPEIPAPFTVRGTIDLTPTWSAILPVLVEVAARGTTERGRAEAMAELQRMARIADAAVAAEGERNRETPQG